MKHLIRFGLVEVDGKTPRKDLPSPLWPKLIVLPIFTAIGMFLATIRHPNLLIIICTSGGVAVGTLLWETYLRRSSHRK